MTSTPTPLFTSNPKFRQTAYFAGTVLLAILGLVQIYTGISADHVANISNTITGLLTLIGGAAPAVAGFKVASQRNDGIL